MHQVSGYQTRTFSIYIQIQYSILTIGYYLTIGIGLNFPEMDNLISNEY